MKKIIALSAILTIGLGVSAQAQQKKSVTGAVKTAVVQPTTPDQITKAAQADVTKLNGVITLTDQEKQMFQGLFETKYRNLAATSDKQTVYQSIEAKLRATLSADKMAKLDAKPAVLKQLTH